MSHENQNPYVRVDIDMSVEYEAGPGVDAPDVPDSAFVNYVIDEPGPRPGESGLYDGYEATSVTASSRDVVEWQAAHRRFREDVQAAHIRLRAVEDAWRTAKARFLEEIDRAAREYRPVHEEIQNRKLLTEAEDDLIEERRKRQAEAERLVTLEAEDAVLGARSWVIFRGANGRKTLHHVHCPRYANAEQGRHNWSEPIRVPEARRMLGQSNSRACKRCRAEEHVRQAETARANRF